MADEDDIGMRTFRLILLYQQAASVIHWLMRESGKGADIKAALLDGRLDRRGRLLGQNTYRIQGDHIVVMFGRIRIEIDYAHPGAFSDYLLRRHIELNRKLARSHPQYIGIPVAAGLEQLRGQGLIRLVDLAAYLYELSEEGLAKKSELWQADLIE